MFGGGEDVGAARSDPGDLFAAASASSARSDDDGGDLFGSKPAAAQASQGAKLRGERNENSVLFSLNNLAQLASDKPAPAPRPGAVSASPSPGAATGPGGGEGSGLIDIRSMASAYLGAPGGAPKPASAGIGSIDDLPVFGGGGFTEPAVIVPISARSNNNKLLYALIGSVGLLAVAAVVVVIVLISSKSPTAVQAKTDTVAATETKPDVAKSATASEPAVDKAAAGTTAGDSAPGATAPAAGAAAPGAAGGTTPAAAGTGDAKTVKAAPPAEATHTPPATTHKATTQTASTPAKSTTPSKPDKVAAAPPPPKETPAPKADKGGGGDCDEVSCVLNSYEGACCAKFRKGGSRPAAASGGSAPKAGGSDLPDSLDRAMIADGVAKVKGRAQACGDKSSAKGQVKVSVKVSPDGSVTGVTVKNTPDPALGNCVAGVMQSARFARTQNGGAFAYPFQF
jgi:hypothetical protein